MTREEYLKELIKEQGSQREFADKIGMPTSTLHSILKNVGGAAIDNIIKICKGLGITTEDLEAIGPEVQIPGSPTSKAERDIQRRLNAILNELDSDAGLAFYNGGEEMDDETRELLKISLENSIRLAKKRAQQKFTPKKYKS